MDTIIDFLLNNFTCSNININGIFLENVHEIRRDYIPFIRFVVILWILNHWCSKYKGLMRTNNFYFVCLAVLQMDGDYPDRNWFCLLPLYQTHNIIHPSPTTLNEIVKTALQTANIYLVVELILSTIILWLDPVFKWIFHQSIMIHCNEMRPKGKLNKGLVRSPVLFWVFVTQDSVLYLLNCPHNVSLEGALIMTQYST